METDTSYCKNCEAPLSGPYCKQCGQRATVYKVTFRETLEDFFDSVFSVNAPFFYTLKGLFVNPGQVFRNYLAGKRRRYYKPVAFFILMTIAYLVIRSLITFDPFANTTLSVTDDSQRQLLTEARNFMLININKLLFVFVFTLGILIKLFFWRNRSLAEFLAISFYLTAVYTIFTTLNMFYVKYVNDGTQYLAILFMMLYFVYAMVQFFERRKLLVAIKSLILFLMAFVSYGFLAFGVSFLIIYIKST